MTAARVSLAATLLLITATLVPARPGNRRSRRKPDATRVAVKAIDKMKVGRRDWPQWGGWAGRNNTPRGRNIPHEWGQPSSFGFGVGRLKESGRFEKTQKNIKWAARLGSQSYGSPVVANGKIFVGTNNAAGYLKRFSQRVDLGCLLCFEEWTGKFLWQASSQKLPTGRVHDMPMQGICGSPYVDHDRLWYVTSRGEVVCLDTEGFHDGRNDGPFRAEPNEHLDEADVVWVVDMMKQLGTLQHNMCTCSVTSDGKRLFVTTGNGVSYDHRTVPAPAAPSFLVLDRDSGKVLWTDNSPADKILHGSWSSPTNAKLGGQPQVLFGGGDGWLYSFDPKGNGRGGSRLLWKFDCNPKAARWILGGRGSRNGFVSMAVVYDGLVYITVGQDPEHGAGIGHMWCIDGTRRGDVSPELAVDANGKLIPFAQRRRGKAVDPAAGERAIHNSNSAVVWYYGQKTLKQLQATKFERQWHQSIGSVAIKDDLLFAADFSGLVHCVDARTGRALWTYDLLASAWSSPLIVDGKVYVADEDGDIAIFPLTGDPRRALKRVDGEWAPALGEVNMGDSVYTTPIVANNVLYIASRDTLFAIKDSD
jgi:outer membrane protein assembly factor BamB